MNFEWITEPLKRALFKTDRGFGTTNTEKRLVSDFNKGRDHFAQLQAKPFTLKQPPGPAKSTSIENVEGLEAKLRKPIGETESTGTPGTEGDPVDVVQGDGKLVTVVKHSTAGTPTDYPTILKVENGAVAVQIDSDGIAYTITGGATIQINSNGIKLLPSVGTPAHYAQIDADGILTVTDGTFTATLDPINAEVVVYQGSNYVSIDGTDVQIYNATAAKTLSIAFASITADMGIKTFSGCNSGAPGDYLTIASDFF